ADTLTSGRPAHGERWSFGRFANVLEVVSAERTLVRDALLLDPAHGALAARMGRMEAVATVLLLGPQVAQAAAALVAALAAEPLPRRAALLESASPVAGGALLRLAGESVQAVAQRVRERLAFL